MDGGCRLTPEEIVSGVHGIMIDGFEIEPELLSPDAHLRDDLGLDSLDGVDLVVAIEKKFSVRIEESEARAMLRLGDVVAAIQRRLGATA